MDYFYVPPRNVLHDSITIDGDEFVHLTHVMRKKVGDQFTVVDGKGNAYRVTILALDRKAATCSIQTHTQQLHEPVTDITLAAGVLKNPSRFDVLVEKTTELGVNRIVPLITARTIGRPDKSDRWQKIALAAMKQSGRCVLPEVRPLTPLEDFLRTSKQGTKLIAHEASREMAQVQHDSSLAICIGPEGGFSDEEISLAESHGFRPYSLGPRRLRTETAAITAVSRCTLL